MKTYYKARGEELQTRPKENGTTWKTKNKQPVKQTKELNGRPIPYMVTQEIDQAEVTKQFKPNDFTLENLQEIGMEGKLPITYAQLGALQLIDRLDQGAGKELQRLDAEEWAKTYLKNKEQQTKTKEE